MPLITVHITERDYHRLPYDVQQLVQQASWDTNPTGIVRNGYLSFACEQHYWEKIQAAMRVLTNG